MKHYHTKLRLVAVSTGALLTGLIAPASAYAETGEAAASDSGGLSLLIPNLGEFIPMLIGFIILWALLAKFAWPMILDMLEKRVSTIKNDLEQAETARIQTAQLLDEQKEMITQARQEAATIIADAKAAAEVTKAEIEAQTAQQVEIMLARARALIEQEKKQAMLELRGSVADISVALAGRLIGSDLGESEHRQIIERYVAQAGSFDDN